MENQVFIPSKSKANRKIPTWNQICYLKIQAGRETNSKSVELRDNQQTHETSQVGR